MKPQYSSKEFFEHPENIRAYESWLNDPITKRVLEWIKWESPMCAAPVVGLEPHDAKAIAAHHAAIDGMVRKILTQHEVQEVVQSKDTTYGVKEYLIRAGYPEVEAIRIIEEDKQRREKG